MRFLFLGLILVVCCDVLMAQNGIITDRPTQTASPFLVPKGSFQIETGYNFSSKEATEFCQIGLNCSNSDLELITYNSTLVRYGIFNGVEIRLSQGVNRVRYRNRHDGRIISEGKIKFVPSSISTKIHLLKSNNENTSIALLGEIGGNIFETFEEESLFSDVRMNFQHNVDGLTVAYNLGWQWNQFNGGSNMVYSFVLGFDLGKRVSLFVEPYGFIYKSESPDNRITGGMTFGIGPDLQLDFYGGRSFSITGLHTIFGFGFSGRIPKK